MKDLRLILFVLFVLVLLFQCEQKIENIYEPMQLFSQVQQVTEFGLNDGIIDITITGGEEPINFLWSNSETSEDLNGLSPGVYILVVTDNRNEVITDTFEINQPAPDTISVIFNVNNPSETGVSDGSIQLEVNGGYPPFSYLWSNGEDSKDLVDITAGKYVLIINDSRGQYFTDSVSLVDYLTDFDGNKYATIKIGNQYWMQENLRVTHTSEGTLITSYIYEDDTARLQKYGRLYTWNDAMAGSVSENSQGICPVGWHIPSDEEFKELEMFLGMTEDEANIANEWRGTGVGTKLKAGGSSGYNAVLAGRRAPSGRYSLAERMEYIWTSTESGNEAWRRCLDKYANDVGRWNTFSKSYGFSVRCVKNY